jgi:molybdopterin synthase catalytic subunit
MISIQNEDFDVAAELDALRRTGTGVGAIASFVGLMRDFNDGAAVSAMELEHYPGMAEKILVDLLEQARRRWDIIGARIIHRVGRLEPGDRIVLVAVASAHRADAFAACEFLVDFLKSRGPFWKREQTAGGERWVEARESDNEAIARWKKA